MATYTIIEFNGDHLSDLMQGSDEEDPKNYLAGTLQAIIRNPHGNAERMLQSCDLYRVMRVLFQNGNPIDSTNRTHLWCDSSVKYKPQPIELLEKQVWDVLADLEQLNMNLSSSKLQEITNKLRKVVKS
jgi:hypothetical protein